MADYDKLVEKFFEKKEKVLGADDLKNILIQEYRTRLLEAVKQAEERILKLPKLQISENWGKENTVERAELERIVYSATSGKTDAFERLAVIQKQMTELSSGELGNIKNPSRILSQIMILETMNRLFKSFQPSPAGFINEALLSVFYGGTQKGAGEANVAKDIADVTANGIPISIKTKGKGGLLVDGSIENLYSSINKAGKVYFDIYEKTSEGEEKGKHVGSLKATRFVVDASNINQFLGKNYFDVKDNKLVPKVAFRKSAEKQVQQPEQPIAEGKVGDMIAGVANQIKSSTKEIDQQNMANLLAKFNEGNINDLKELLKQGLIEIDNSVKGQKLNKAQKDEMKKKRDLLSKQIATVATVQVSKRQMAEPEQAGMEREFKIPETQWRPFAESQGFVEEIQISFSDEKLQVTLQRAIESLDQQIVEIFNNLDGFSQSIQSYLTSITKNRNKFGESALGYAKKLEPQTKEVIKSTSDNA